MCAPFLAQHPGGTDNLLRNSGRDATMEFEFVHAYVDPDKILGVLYSQLAVRQSIDTLHTTATSTRSLAHALVPAQ